MKKSPFNLQKLFLLLLLPLIYLCSCTNNVIQTGEAQLSIVFDYDSLDALPKARLTVFVEASSNPARFEYIRVSADKKEYIWESDKLILAQNNEIKYCGLTNLVLPPPEQLPKGLYTVTYIQADQEKKEMKAVLNYESSFYNCKGSEVPKMMEKFMGARMLTVYDEENKIIYYGPRSSQFADARGIWNEYPEAFEFQESWISANSNVVCNLPVEKVLPGN